MGWQSIRIVCVSASVIFILHQKIQKMAKCTTRVVLDKVQSAVNGCACVCVCVCNSKYCTVVLFDNILQKQSTELEAVADMLVGKRW